MRKAIFQAATGLLCAILSVGCTSDQLDQREDPSQEIQVTFNVSPLSVSTGEIPGTGTGARAKAATRAAVTGEDLGDLVKEIGYYIYKGENLYKSGSVSFDPATQEAPEGFGSFQEKILPGSYDVIFYAYGRNAGTPKIDYTSDKGLFNFSDYTSDGNNVELFIYKGTMDITGSQTEINVTLQRVSSLLSIQISDSPIADVAYLKFNLKNCYQYYPMAKWAYLEHDHERVYEIKTAVTDGVLPVTNIYFMNTYYTQRTLTISIYDHADQLLGSQEVSLPLYANRRTIVSGNLFSNLGDKPLTITINDSWGADVPVNLN